MVPWSETNRTMGGDDGPSALAGLARLVVRRLKDGHVDPAPLLKSAGLSQEMIASPGTRIPARSQIAFLSVAAEALHDDLLGFHIGRDGELRELGALYYVMASATTLGDALGIEQSYSWMIHEGIRTTYSRGECVIVDVHYPGIERELGRHEMEFWLACTLRKCRRFTGTDLVPDYVGFVHGRVGDAAEVEAFFGLPPTYAAAQDRLCLDAAAADLPLLNADPYLMNLILSPLEAKRASGEGRADPLRMQIEDSIASRLPERTAQLDRVAEDLGMSPRTLARRLAEREESFADILDALRATLAMYHLSGSELSISQIAWLLGYREASSFVRAMKRWSGASPGKIRRDLRTP